MHTDFYSKKYLNFSGHSKSCIILLNYRWLLKTMWQIQQITNNDKFFSIKNWSKGIFLFIGFHLFIILYSVGVILQILGIEKPKKNPTYFQSFYLKGIGKHDYFSEVWKDLENLYMFLIILFQFSSLNMPMNADSDSTHFLLDSILKAQIAGNGNVIMAWKDKNYTLDASEKPSVVVKYTYSKNNTNMINVTK